MDLFAQFKNNNYLCNVIKKQIRYDIQRNFPRYLCSSNDARAYSLPYLYP